MKYVTFPRQWLFLGQGLEHVCAWRGRDCTDMNKELAQKHTEGLPTLPAVSLRHWVPLWEKAFVCIPDSSMTFFLPQGKSEIPDHVSLLVLFKVSHVVVVGMLDKATII